MNEQLCAKEVEMPMGGMMTLYEERHSVFEFQFSIGAFFTGRKHNRKNAYKSVRMLMDLGYKWHTAFKPQEDDWVISFPAMIYEDFEKRVYSRKDKYITGRMMWSRTDDVACEITPAIYWEYLRTMYTDYFTYEPIESYEGMIQWKDGDCGWASKSEVLNNNAD